MSFDKAKFAEITSKTHTEQAVWWLNGFWKDGAEAAAEDIWGFVHTMIEIESGAPKLYGKRKQEVKEGCDLDEMKSHVFLEKLGNTLTVRELRARLKEIDIDNNNMMALSEYLLEHYKRKPKELVDAPQGDTDPEKLAAAQAAVAAASEALDLATEARAAAQRAQDELAAAVAALEAEEKAFADKLASLQAKAEDTSTGTVGRMKAKNLIAQMKSEDPMPLRKAKITQGAALKRSEKATKAAEESLKAAQQAFADAEDQLEAIKKAGGGVAHGAVWWLERELTERRKFMPGR